MEELAQELSELKVTARWLEQEIDNESDRKMKKSIRLELAAKENRIAALENRITELQKSRGKFLFLRVFYYFLLEFVYFLWS